MQTSEHNIFELYIQCLYRSVDVFANSVSSKSKRNETEGVYYTHIIFVINGPSPSPFCVNNNIKKGQTKYTQKTYRLYK